MDKLKYIRIQQENDQYYGDIPIGVNAENVDLRNGNNLQQTLGDYNYIEYGNIKEKFDSINRDIASAIEDEANIRQSENETLNTQINVLKAAVGSPLVASTVAKMTDKTKVYVYVGNQSGYTYGHWYYWDGSAWADGGVYNETALETDTTLSISGMAADAKVTGDEITELKNDLGIVVKQTKNINTAGIGNYRNNSAGKILAADNKYVGFPDMVACKPNTTYTISLYEIGYNAEPDIWCAYFDSERNLVSRINNGKSTSGHITITTPNTTAYIHVYAYKSTGFRTNETSGIQVEEGSEPTFYIPSGLITRGLYDTYLTIEDMVSDESLHPGSIVFVISKESVYIVNEIETIESVALANGLYAKRAISQGWYFIQKLDQFALSGTISQKSLNVDDGYVEDIAYKNSQKIYYIATSQGYIYTVNASNYHINTSVKITNDAIISITYDPDDDIVVASSSDGWHIIDPMTLAELFVSTISINAKLAYDQKRRVFVGIANSTDTATVTEYTYNNGTFVAGQSYIVHHGSAGFIQGCCVSDGIILGANLSEIIEADYRHDKCRSIALSSRGPYFEEPEGFCIVDDSPVMITNVTASRNSNIYKYGVESYSNYVTIQTLNNVEYKYYGLTGGIPLPENADLDGYTVVGNYYCKDDAVAATLQHCPIVTGFTLKLTRPRGDGPYRMQTIEQADQPFTTFKRIYDGSVWGNWYSQSYVQN